MAGWLDLFSREVSGWAVDNNMAGALVTSALYKVIVYNQLKKGSVIHADREYIGTEFGKILRLHQFEQSIARADEVYNNAFVELYWSQLKAELVYQRVFRTVADAGE